MVSCRGELVQKCADSVPYQLLRHIKHSHDQIMPRRKYTIEMRIYLLINFFYKKCKLFSSIIQVYHFAQKEGPVGFVQEEGPIEEDSSSASGEKPNKPKTKLRLWSIHTQKLREVAGELRHAAISFVPCNHPGEECAQNCYCILTGKACEKFCHCSLDCINRYPGCECKGQCNTKQCPCYSDARECDADLCRCSAHEHEKSKIKCKNVGIQKAFHKHLVMGQSDVSGWGCFLKEGAVKNEFIGEYTGEIISDSEADRRGAVYDARNCSYLFALNEGTPFSLF